MRPSIPLAWTLVVLLLVGARAAPAEETVAAPQKASVTGELTVRGGLPVLRLWGTPHERGFAHGYLLAEAIVQGADRSLDTFFGDRRAVYENVMLPLAKNAFSFSAEEGQELAGLLEGLEKRLPRPEDRMLHCLERPPTAADLLLLNVFGDVYALGCASLAVWGSHTKDGETMVVRNFDFPALDLVVSKQHVRVVAPREGAKGFVGISYPGGIGMLTVLNEAGVFAAIHDVHMSPGMQDLTQKNVPRLIAIRRLAETLDAAGAVERATELCRGWNTLYGNNFMVATPRPGSGAHAGVLEYDTRETDDRGVDLRVAADDDEHVFCTNHHVVRGSGSCWRYDVLTGACRDDDPAPVTVAELFDLAGRISFPKAGEVIEPGRLGTLHQVVAETGARRLHVRMAGVGGDIRKASPVTFDVAADVGAARPKAPR